MRSSISGARARTQSAGSGRDRLRAVAWATNVSRAEEVIDGLCVGASPTRLQHRGHALVNELDRLQRADHHLELDDAPGLVPLEDVDSVDEHAVDLRFELEHGIARADDLAHVAKRRV